jgi:hypothetical protein
VNDPLAALLQPLGLASSAFPPDSRYAGVPTAKFATPDGRTVSYVTRRVLPQPSELVTLQHVAIHEGERLDRLAARHLGDPLAFWRICDANGAMQPDDLTARPGSTIRLTLPAGIPGAPRA